jgi:transcriptional regulator with PAS, ATPase and Fis domain
MVSGWSRRARKTRAMREIEERYGRPIEQVLTEVFNRHGSYEEAAAELGIDHTTLWRWMDGLGICVRATAIYPCQPTDLPHAADLAD